jgi:putative ABC transport system permease protein
MYRGYDAFFVRPKDKEEQIALPVLSVDDKFISMLGLQWKTRAVTDGTFYDNHHIVVNETAAGKLNLPQDPVGQPVQMGTEKYIVAGVLKDFNFGSLQEKIGPLCLFIGKDTASAWGNRVAGCLFLKIKPHTNILSLIEAVKKIYSGYDKSTAFSFEFMDDAFDSMYKAEDRLAKLFDLFTVITILLACMGLFALAAFTARQRTKE